MSKVVISKNGKRKTTTQTAFDNFFKDAGWLLEEVEDKEVDEWVDEHYKKLQDSGQLSDDENPEEDENKNSDEDAEAEDDSEWDDIDVDDETEKPISSMNRSELVEKAEKMGIDISGLSNNREIRKAIQEAM